MVRKPNLYNLEIQNLRRYQNFNPIFDILKNDFGDALLGSRVDDDYIVEHYYIDERESENVTNKAIFPFFQNELKMIYDSTCIVKEISNNMGCVYLLIGKKGIGKTTTLKYYHQKVLPKIENNDNNISIYLDLRDKWSDDEFKRNIQVSLINEIFIYIRKMPEISKYLKEPKFARKLDIAYKYLPDDRLVERILDHKEEAIKFLFEYLKSHKYKIILIIDNIDDFGATNVRNIIIKCRELKNEYGAQCIVAVRDYWTPRNLDIDDSQLCSLHLSKPNIKKIIEKRLKSIDTSSVTDYLELVYDNKVLRLNGSDIVDSFYKIIDDLMSTQNTLQDQLFQLSNYNVREFLENLYYFFHSPYLFSRPNFIGALLQKIKEVDKSFEFERPRPSMFFDFLEGFMTPHALCYDNEDSRIFNIFQHTWDYSEGHSYKNTLMFIRILQILPENLNTIDKQTIVNQLLEIGYYDEKAIKNATSILLKKALLESPDGSDFEDVQNIKLSAKGLIYLNRLINEYTYLVYICDVVPMEDGCKVDIHQKFGNEDIPLLRGDLALKHKSVRQFIRFIEHEEKTEEVIARASNSMSALNKIRGKPSKISNRMNININRSIDKMTPIQGQKNAKKITSIRKIGNKDG